MEAAQGMAAYKQPSAVVFLEPGEMPLNRVAKTDYMALTERAKRTRGTTTSEWGMGSSLNIEHHSYLNFFVLIFSLIEIAVCYTLFNQINKIRRVISPASDTPELNSSSLKQFRRSSVLE